MQKLCGRTVSGGRRQISVCSTCLKRRRVQPWQDLERACRSQHVPPPVMKTEDRVRARVHAERQIQADEHGSSYELKVSSLMIGKLPAYMHTPSVQAETFTTWRQLGVLSIPLDLLLSCPSTLADQASRMDFKRNKREVTEPAISRLMTIPISILASTPKENVLSHMEL